MPMTPHETRVMDLHDAGRSEDFIVQSLDLTRSAVRTIVKRYAMNVERTDALHRASMRRSSAQLLSRIHEAKEQA